MPKGELPPVEGPRLAGAEAGPPLQSAREQTSTKQAIAPIQRLVVPCDGDSAGFISALVIWSGICDNVWVLNSSRTTFMDVVLRKPIGKVSFMALRSAVNRPLGYPLLLCQSLVGSPRREKYNFEVTFKISLQGNVRSLDF